MVGIIKDALTNAILDGVIPNDAEAARKFILDYYQANKDKLIP
jgi:hypothetical protein